MESQLNCSYMFRLVTAIRSLFFKDIYWYISLTTDPGDRAI